MGYALRSGPLAQGFRGQPPRKFSSYVTTILSIDSCCILPPASRRSFGIVNPIRSDLPDHANRRLHEQIRALEPGRKPIIGTHLLG